MNNHPTIDKNKTETSMIFTIMAWLVTVIVPVVLTLGAVRVIMSPWLLRFEYNSPGFPADRYGFTKTDRFYWSQIALDYLLNTDDVSFLADLVFEDGTDVYNERELQHMVDVKIVLSGALTVLYISLGALVALGIWAWFGDWWDKYLQGIARGGWLTVIILGSLILFVLISFGVLFVAFHNVFFEPGTWKFFFSDTLIRLFPERFWRDLFIIVGMLSIGSGLLIGLGLRKRL